MKTTPDQREKDSTRPARARSRHGYDRRWWGDDALADDDPSYWSGTRRPLTCLLFILPLLAAYEIGVVRLGGASAGAWRTGSDAWFREGLLRLGVTDRFLPPVAVILALLGWQAAGPRSTWRFRPLTFAGMIVESGVFALGLIGLSRLVDLGFDEMESRWLLDVDPPATPTGGLILGFVGAGIYEEAMFRLALIPTLYGLARLLQVPQIIAGTFAISLSSLAFSMAHHAGPAVEPFTWFAFIFRWVAGIYFAWIFVVRGFGVAVGTHAAYDVLVGAFDWHL